jgi:hypothetical protein
VKRLYLARWKTFWKSSWEMDSLIGWSLSGVNKTLSSIRVSSDSNQLSRDLVNLSIASTCIGAVAISRSTLKGIKYWYCARKYSHTRGSTGATLKSILGAGRVWWLRLEWRFKMTHILRSCDGTVHNCSLMTCPSHACRVASRWLEVRSTASHEIADEFLVGIPGLLHDAEQLYSFGQILAMILLFQWYFCGTETISYVIVERFDWTLFEIMYGMFRERGLCRLYWTNLSSTVKAFRLHFGEVCVVPVWNSIHYRRMAGSPCVALEPVDGDWAGNEPLSCWNAAWQMAGIKYDGSYNNTPAFRVRLIL